MRYTMESTFFSPDEFDSTANGKVSEPSKREPDGSKREPSGSAGEEPGTDEDESATRSALMDTYNPS